MPTVTAELIAKVAGFINPLKAATQTVRDLRTELSAAAAAGKLDAVASSAMKYGLALSGGFLIATAAAARFEKQMSEVDAVSGATASELDALSKAALEAGKSTVFSASEAAKAEAELAKAGLSTSAILGGALSGSLSLAAAGSLDLAEAADVAAKAMNVFNLTGGDVGHIADVLAAGANKSATDVHELGAALRMGGLAAKNAGLTLEDTVGILAAFADNALIGSDAGTSLKTMLQALAAPSAEATKRMKELGIEAYDSQGQFIGVARLAGVLSEKLGDLTQQQRNEALATIFGADAMRSATVLFGEGEAGIRGYIAAVDDQGAAAETARKKTDNLMGDVERLTGALEALFITSETGASGGLRTLVQGAEHLVDAIAALPPPVLTAGTVLIGLSGAGLLALSTFVRARGAFHDAVSELEAMGPTGQRAGRGLQFVANNALKAAVGIAAVTAILEAGQESIRVHQGFVDELARKYDAFGKTGVESTRNVDAELAKMVQSGHGAEALASVAAAADKAGISIETAKNHLPTFTAALAAAGEVSVEQAKAAEQTKTANIALAGAFGEAASEAEGLLDAFDRLNGKTLSLREAQRDAEAAVDDLAEALDKSSGSLDINTEEGRTASAAADKLAESAAVVAQRTYEQTGSVEAANVAFQGYIGALRQTLINAGMTEEAVDTLIGSIGQMPSYKPVVFDVIVTGNWGLAKSLMNAEHESRVYVNYGQRWGGITEHAATGLLRQATTFSAGPTRYAFAERATGGEAFIPKHGNYNRSMSILSQAAGWYGAKVTTAPEGGTRGEVDYERLGATIVKAMRNQPLQGVVVMDGRTVGELQGRQANLMNRGG